MSLEVALPYSVCHRELMNLSLGFPCSGAYEPSGSGSPQCSRSQQVTKTSVPLGGTDTKGVHCEDCTRARDMSPHELHGRMQQSGPFLLLDCRSFIAFNLNHINGALNISCADRLTKRRLACGKTHVKDLVAGNPEAKQMFRELCEGAEIVLYDDDTSGCGQLAATMGLHLVLSSLVREGIPKVHVLKGGLSEFQCKYSSLCSRATYVEGKSRLISPTTPVVQAKIETTTATEILPYLYLGNAFDACNDERIRDLGITHVLNVTSHLPFHMDGQHLVTKRLAASDSAQQNLSQYFADACEFIESTARSGGRVLIHCQAGVSRSATLTVAYLMKRTSLSMVDAYKYVKTRRDIIAPNFNFMGQLLEFEQSLKEGRVERILEPRLPLHIASL